MITSNDVNANLITKFSVEIAANTNLTVEKYFPLQFFLLRPVYKTSATKQFESCHFRVTAWFIAYKE